MTREAGRDYVKLKVLTPEAILFDGDVDWVQIPLEDGLLGIWPLHAPLVAATAGGDVLYRREGEEHRISTGQGVLRIDTTHCVVMFGSLLPVAETPERDMEALATGLEDALYDSLSETEIKELQERGQ